MTFDPGVPQPGAQYPAAGSNPYAPSQGGQPSLAAAGPYQTTPGGYPDPAGRPQPSGTDGFSLAALITAILGLGLVPVILGIVSLTRIKKSGQGGRGLAIAGIVLGVLEIVAGIAVLVSLVSIAGNEDFQEGLRSGYEQGLSESITMEEGTCFLSDAGIPTLDTMTRTGCDGPHRGEVIGAYTFPDGDYPGQKRVDAAAGKECNKLFESYVGTDFQTSVLDMGYLYPTNASWTLGDRWITCYAMTMDGSPLKKSVQGTAK
ncbi:DUF4190 domain-containing protein [Myceligenerans crystallogenes]|uniref:DUF4190 domain-containing protein n=1 Tax=Myceligenerans crystallogenes TaxID=316335 RepID=A0ABP4ZB93_9MICO